MMKDLDGLLISTLKSYAKNLRVNPDLHPTYKLQINRFLTMYKYIESHRQYIPEGYTALKYYLEEEKWVKDLYKR